ncbi:nesp041 [Neophasia sp. alphabaculovirus]|nr:nesp041 [Neophasia sp. alphabaculovirus]
MSVTAHVLYVPNIPKCLVNLQKYVVVDLYQCCNGDYLALLLVEDNINIIELEVLETVQECTLKNIKDLREKICVIINLYNKYLNKE